MTLLKVFCGLQRSGIKSRSRLESPGWNSDLGKTPWWLSEVPPPAVKLGCFGWQKSCTPPIPRQRPGRHQKVLRRWKLEVGGWGVQWGFVFQKTDDDHHTRMYGFRFFVVVVVVVGIFYGQILISSSFSRIVNNGLYCNQFFFWGGVGMLIRRPRCQWTGWMVVCVLLV